MSVEYSDNLSIGEVRRSLSFGSNTMENTDVTTEGRGDLQTAVELLPAEEQLKNECESIWQELNNTQARLEARYRNHTSQADDEEFVGSKVLEKVLRVKGKKLQTELLALENKGLQVMSTNPEYIEALVQEQLVDSIKQMKETLEVVKAQQKEVNNDLKQEEEILRQHKEVRNSLQKKIEAFEQEKENVEGVTSQVCDFERKKKAADRHLLQTMKKLGSFLSENFPPPSAEDMKGKHGKVHVDPKTRYVSLQQLTEDLMNLSYSRPHDPYIAVNESHWPPYLELLLRCGIAQRHPQNSSLIGLVAFDR